MINLIEEKFSQGGSFLHRLDPRVKIIVIIIFSVVVAVTDRYKSLSFALLFAIVLVIMAKLKAREIIFRLVVVNSFIFLLWLILPFTLSGIIIYSIGSLNISLEGINYAFLITLKSNTIVLASLVLLSTSPIFNLVHALSHLHFPDKLIYLFFFTYRYIQTIHSEYVRLNNALKIRGFKAQTNFHTYRTYAYLVGIMLIRSYDRSQRIYNAMLCRGFKGKFWILNHFSFKRSDLISGIIMVSWIIGLVLYP